MSHKEYRNRLYRQYAAIGYAPNGALCAAEALARGRYLLSATGTWIPAERSTAIADLGCGRGEVVLALRLRGYTDVCGVDLGADQVVRGQEVLGRALQCGDVMHFLASSRSRFDVLLALDIVEHMDRGEILDFLQGCREALRPNGQLILQTPNGASPHGVSVFHSDLTHETCLTQATMRAVLGLSGFTDVRLREAGPRPISIPSTLRWLSWKVIRQACAARHLIETGGGGERIYTRVFFAHGRKGP